jgi:hypothetical protein
MSWHFFFRFRRDSSDFLAQSGFGEGSVLKIGYQ